MRTRFYGAAVAALLAAALAPALARADCATTIGVVMELTGPAGEYGQKASKAVELALKDINDAGGAAGCTLAADIRDAQSQGAVGTDAHDEFTRLAACQGPADGERGDNQPGLDGSTSRHCLRPAIIPLSRVGTQRAQIARFLTAYGQSHADP